MFEQILAERHGDGNVASVAAATDQDPADAACVMSRVESMRVRAKIDLHPCTEIPGLDVGRDPNIAEIPCRITRRYIHAPAQGDRQMRKIAADADFFPEGFQSGAIRARLQVIEAEMAVDKFDDGLYAWPSKGHLTKSPPGEIEQFAVDFTIAARQQERERFHRQISNIMLRRVRDITIQFSRVAYDCIVQKTNHAHRRVDSATMVSEIVHIFLDWQARFCPEVLRFDEVLFTRRMNVQDVNHRRWTSQTQRNIVPDPNKH